ncbi:MAG: FUSC family protein [Burkholderiaceae bacterium]|jgi:uncharacterized membrane protein YccC|nr:FUSC family protein [Burkholderiaceae bacterium]
MKLPIVPTAQEWLFSIKCFVSAMLAVYISLRIGVTHPFWALGTCYVIASPLAGPVRSKGVYRAIGTVVSGLMVIVSIPLLSGHRFLFILFVMLWVGVCLYISMLDRTPRAYTFMLAGYTLFMVGLPVLATPGAFAAAPFEAAVDRSLEIIIGLCSSAIVHGLFFPQSVGSVLLQRMDQAIDSVRQWAAGVLVSPETTDSLPLHRQLAQYITELRLMSTHLPFDTHNIRWTASVARVLYDKLATLLPLLSGMDDRMKALRNAHSSVRSAPWVALLADIADWCRDGRISPDQVSQFHQRLDQLAPETDMSADWETVLQVNLASALHWLVDELDACFTLRHQIEVGVTQGLLQDVPDMPAVSPRVLHTDKQMAFMSALAVSVGVAVTMTFWVITDWPGGFNAPMFAGIMGSIFATQDDPTIGQKISFRFTVYSVPIAAAYLLILVPGAHTIEALAIVLAPFLICAGINLARPQKYAAYLMLIMAVDGMLVLYDYGAPDLMSFINGQIAMLFGIATAFFSTTLFRNLSIERTVRRLVRSIEEDIAKIAAAMRPVSVTAILVRMVDCVSLLAPRIASADRDSSMSSINVMGELRVGMNAGTLLNAQPFMQRSGISPDHFMKGLSAYFTGKLEKSESSGKELLVQLDRLLYRACGLPLSPEKNRIVAALAGIRRDIFPDALFLRAAVARKNVE